MKLTAFKLGHLLAMGLQPATLPEWLRTTPLPRRCWPMRMAALSGWVVELPSPVRATWNGGPGRADLVVEQDPHLVGASSHSGAGTITWPLPWTFLTEPGWSLRIGPQPNTWKDGAIGLTGDYEADRVVTASVAVWKFTRPGTVTWNEGEVIAMITPVKRGQLEQFTPELRDIRDEPEVHELYVDHLVRVQSGEVRTHYIRAAEQKRTRLRPFKAMPA